MVSFVSLNKSKFDTPKKVAFVLTEKYNRQKIKKIASCTTVENDDREFCKQLLRTLGSRKSLLQVPYSFPEPQFENDEFIGRLYAGKFSYQQMHRNLRNFLACDIYTDFDIVNCHPVLLSQLCSVHNIPVDFIHKLQNRDALCTELGISKETLKDELRLVTNKEDHRSKYKVLSDIHTELYKVVVPALKMHYPSIVGWVPEEKTWNRNGSFLSYVLNYTESIIIEKYVQYFKSIRVNVHSIIHDGILIEKKHQVNSSTLRNADDYVFEHTGFRVNLVDKPMESKYLNMDLEFGMIPSDVLVDDAFAGSRLVEVSDDEIVYCRTTGSLWHFDNKLGVWTSELNALHEKISKEYLTDLVFKQLDAQGSVRVFNYAGDVCKRRKMLEMAKDFVKKYDYFIEEQIDTSRG